MSGWLTIQLSERGEDVLNEDPTVIERSLKKITNSEYFIPVHFNKSKAYDNKIFLFTGYVFIKYESEEVSNYLKFSNNIYFEGPLTVSKKFYLTPDSEILKLKSELEKITTPSIKKGDYVKVIDGKYKNLDAEVTDFNEESREADLRVKLKCMHIIVPSVPSSCLVKIEEEDIIFEKKNESKNLEKIILNLLEEEKEGITKKQIFINLNLTEKETKIASDIINSFLEKNIIFLKVGDKGKKLLFIR